VSDEKLNGGGPSEGITTESIEAPPGSYEAYAEWAAKFAKSLHWGLDKVEVVPYQSDQMASGSTISPPGLPSIELRGSRQAGVYVFDDHESPIRRETPGDKTTYILTEPDGTLAMGSMVVVNLDNQRIGVSYEENKGNPFDLKEQQDLLRRRDLILASLHEKNEIRRKISPFNPPAFVLKPE